jgi:hypothetical protein
VRYRLLVAPQMLCDQRSFLMGRRHPRAADLPPRAARRPAAGRAGG